MKIATWNVNSIRARLEQVIFFLQEYNIDVILLQELKCQTEVFPKEEFENIGYNCAIFGQKSYNGVAILSKYLIEDVRGGSAIFAEDQQARYIDAFINNCRIASVYVPNGQSPDSVAYFYKLNFLDILNKHIEFSQKNELYIIGGDFNIALEDRDVYDPIAWKDKICCTNAERIALKDILKNRLVDSARVFCDDEAFTWFNYRISGFLKRQGLRLDYILADQKISLLSCDVNLKMRANPRPSDHAPVIAILQ